MAREVAQLEIAPDNLIYTIGCVRSSIERSEKHRVSWVTERDGDLMMNDITENHILTLFRALEDLTAGLLKYASDKGYVNPEPTLRDNRQLFDHLEEGRDKLDYCAYNSTGWALRMTAKRMGMITQEQHDALDAKDAERWGEQREARKNRS